MFLSEVAHRSFCVKFRLRTLKGQATLSTQDKPVMSNSINYGLQYLESLKCTFISPAKNLFRTRTLICNLSGSFFKKKKEKKRNKRKNIFASSPIPCLHTNISSLRLQVKVTLIHYVVSLPFLPVVALAKYTRTLRSFF